MPEEVRRLLTTGDGGGGGGGVPLEPVDVRSTLDLVELLLMRFAPAVLAKRPGLAVVMAAVRYGLCAYRRRRHGAWPPVPAQPSRLGGPSVAGVHATWRRIAAGPTIEDYFRAQLAFVVRKQTTETELLSWVRLLSHVVFDAAVVPTAAEKERARDAAWQMLCDFVPRTRPCASWCAAAVSSLRCRACHAWGPQADCICSLDGPS